MRKPLSHNLSTRKRKRILSGLFIMIKIKISCWRGRGKGAVHLFDSSGNAIWDEPLTNASIKHMLAIEKLSDDHYLIITQGSGLRMFRLKTKKILPC